MPKSAGMPTHPRILHSAAVTTFPALPVALGGMIAMAGAMGIGRFVYTPILPVMIAALHLSKAQAGLIASANFLGYLIGALLAAIGTLPGQRRLWLLGALAASGATTAAMGASDSLPAFLALRFLGGAASAFVLVLASALVLEHLALVRRPQLSSLHFAGVGIGIAVSAVTVSSALAAEATWQQLWFIVGTIVLASCLAVMLLIPPESRPAAAPGAADRGATGLSWLIAAYGLFGFGYVITATFLIAIVRASPDMRSAEALVWLLVGLTAAPSVALWGRLAARTGARTAYSLACVLQAIGVAASVLWPSAVGALLSAVLLGGTFMGLTALGLAEARRLVPDNPRPALAMMTAAFGLGQVIGPALAGFLSDRAGSFTLPSLVAAGALLAAALIAQVRPRRRTR
ncbi:MAG: YbfB/YjiJ family MFS transporter [Rhodopila sp.]